MSFNASSLANGQQWRHELLLKSVDPPVQPSQDLLKDPLTKYTNQLIASTVCCSKTNCDKFKLETLPERFFRRDSAQGSQGSTPATTNPDGRDVPNGKKEIPVFSDSYAPFCPCVINRGHLITVCCVRRDCDDASKIAGMRDRPRTHAQFKH